MAGDPLKKVKPGDPLVFPAEAFNTFVDAARAFRDSAHDLGKPAPAAFRQATIIRVQNSSGGPRAPFEILGLDVPLPTPTDDLEAFRESIAFDGVTPAAASHTGKFCILLEPVESEAVGYACVAGVCPVMLAIMDGDHEYADAANGSYEYLRTVEHGAAQILWRESGDSGQKWAIVRIGNYGRPGLYGKAIANWVTDGTATGNGSYVNVNPCTRLGADVKTGITHKVWLPRNGRREDPNVRLNDVISYVQEVGGGYVNQSGCLDGKINESIRIHWGDPAHAPANIPAGWALCDNAGGSLVDLREKVIGGYKSGDPNWGTMGNVVGAATHLHDAHADHQHPAHAHELLDGSDFGATGCINYSSVTDEQQGGAAGGDTHSTGGNIQPTTVVCLIFRKD